MTRDLEVGRWGLVALALIHVLAGIGLASTTPVLSQIATHFSATPGAGTLVRGTVTAAGAAMIFGAPMAALLSERYGERRVLAGALFVFAVAGTAGAVLDNLWLLVASRALVGLAVAATGVAGIALLTKSVGDDQRNRWIGYVSVVGSLSSVISIPLAGVLGSIDWRLVFTLHLVAIPILAMVILFVRQPPPVRHLANSVRASSRFPLALVFLGVACGAVTTALPLFVPFHLNDIGETAPARIAVPLTATVVSAALASFLYGRVRRRLGAIEVFAVSFLLASSGAAIVAASTGIAVAAAGMLVIGLGMGLIIPNLAAAASEGDPELRARRIGVAHAGFFGAPLLVQFALEPLTLSAGAGAALFAIAGFGLSMIAVVLLGRRMLVAA